MFSCCLPWVSLVQCELHYMKITVFMCFPESPREELEEPKTVYFRLMRKQILRTSVLFLALSCVADCSFLENMVPSGCWDGPLESVLFLSHHPPFMKVPSCARSLQYLVILEGFKASPWFPTGIPIFLYNLMSCQLLRAWGYHSSIVQIFCGCLSFN